jgi:hypothetical protein
LICDGELLSERNANEAGQRQLLLRKVVARGNQLLLARLQLDVGTQPVNRCRRPSVESVYCLFVECTRRITLCLRRVHARRMGDCLQVGCADGDHHLLADILV